MGTNYFLHKDVCEHCGHAKDVVHIGKSSYGWCFLVHSSPIDGIETLEDWKNEFDKGVIKNEYGDVVTKDAMLEIITNRADNSLRHSPGSSHGPGSWDYMTGYFR